MEEDIKILEDYIKLINKGYCDDCNELCNIYGTPAFPSRAISQAIENLIKGYRDLKYKLKEKICFEGHRQFKELQENTIPKSKVKEKIEELLKKLDEPNNDRWEKDDDIYYNKIKAQIRIIQELMEE